MSELAEMVKSAAQSYLLRTVLACTITSSLFIAVTHGHAQTTDLSVQADAYESAETEKRAIDAPPREVIPETPIPTATPVAATPAVPSSTPAVLPSATPETIVMKAPAPTAAPAVVVTIPSPTATPVKLSTRAIKPGTGVTAIQKVAVFPVLYKGERGDKVDDATAKSLDDTWWQVRDQLTQTGRFVVASRAFLQKADAFQPRGKLTVGDAVILGRYLEADALMTMTLKDRTLSVSIFNSGDGTVAWSQDVDLHPSILVREQVAKIARALVKEFIAALPYQAITVQDALSKQAVYVEAGKRFARLKTGHAKLNVGDPVQWIEVTRENLKPLYQGGMDVDVRAEGIITEVRDQGATAELTRIASINAVQAGTLVTLPFEQARLTNSAKPKDSATSAAVVSLLAGTAAIEPEAKQAERLKDDSGPVATTLSILGSLAIILLLAF